MTTIESNFDQSSVSSNNLIEETNSQPIHQLFGCNNLLEYDHLCRYLVTGDMSPLLVQRLQNLKKEISIKGGNYLLTFTRDPNLSLQQWWKQLVKALGQTIHTIRGASIEHIDTNIHCHLVCSSKYNLSKDRYKGFKSNIDFRKISQDNGIEDYISKENESFSILTEFVDFYKNKIFSN